jgi:hypothetical protein
LTASFSNKMVYQTKQCLLIFLNELDTGGLDHCILQILTIISYGAFWRTVSRNNLHPNEQLKQEVFAAVSSCKNCNCSSVKFLMTSVADAHGSQHAYNKMCLSVCQFSYTDEIMDTRYTDIWCMSCQEIILNSNRSVNWRSCKIMPSNICDTNRTLTFLYLSRLTVSSWESRTRLVPTRIRNSSRSRSRRSLSRECPWCCIRTHNLFISAKFIKIKSMESRTCLVHSTEWKKKQYII